jgi:hypothetical protein
MSLVHVAICHMTHIFSMEIEIYDIALMFHDLILGGTQVDILSNKQSFKITRILTWHSTEVEIITYRLLLVMIN